MLSENCFPCHGPDRESRKAKLRLDTREGLFGDRWGDHVVVPGDPATSLLIQRITTDDPDDVMPPRKSGKTLTRAEKERFRRWIVEGAPWQGHWAYEPVRRPPVPRTEPASGARNPVDDFLLARLQREGIQPRPPADRRTLIRRLSLDLTGLPPSPAETRAFLEDKGPGAWERLLDRLISSPHFGERMAIYWLDLVRYADTDGFHADNARSVWPYRDYVIRAFNENKPFDRFTLEQLAGDLLPDATLETRVASTYNRLGRSTEEGGAQPKEYLAKYAADRVRSLGTAWLGSTTGCCECHDHKFDPFTTKDFYQLEAYFADIQEAGVGKRKSSPVPTPEQSARLAELDRSIAALEAKLRTFTPELRDALTAWERETLDRLAEHRAQWRTLTPEHVASRNGATLAVQPDRSVLSSGKNPDRDVYTAVLPAEIPKITGLRLETLTHPDFPKQGLGRANGNFVLSGVELAWQDPDGAAHPIRIARATADFEQKGWPVKHTLDGNRKTGWAVAGHEKPANHQAVFVFAEPVQGNPGRKLRVTLRHESEHAGHAIGRFRLALTDEQAPSLAPFGLPPAVLAALRTPAGERTAEQTARLEKHFLATTPKLTAARHRLADDRKAREKLVASIPTTLMTVAGPPREIRVLPRGNWMDDSGEVVQPLPPAFLSGTSQPPAGKRQTRLDLARWLVSRENPLTARVFVNRLWALFFGVGLSKNLTDFGAQGEQPVHPELLDWLAAEFMDSGWDVKHMVRLMVGSAAYRRDSAAPPELLARDPFNRLYARQSRLRLPAEMIRDQALAVSGLLVERVGGPSVKPYQPAGYWAQLNFPKRTWQPDHGEALYRRGLYTFWCRTFLHPELLNFDACTREDSTAERPVSNTPPQALTLLNDPVFVETARVFAERILRQGGPDTARRLEWAFTRMLGRPPRQQETALLRELWHAERERFAAHPKAAEKLAAAGEAPRDEELPAIEVAAWAQVARALLNLDEAIVRN